jgi:hypothetical protein
MQKMLTKTQTTGMLVPTKEKAKNGTSTFCLATESRGSV